MTFKCNTFSDLERKALHETHVAFYYLFIFTGQEAGLFQFMPRKNVPSA
jgi:hypothetical protein